jgi:transcription termination factor Rho
VSVLQRKELENSPLADLHAIASELGIEGYRALRRDDLIAAVLDIQGGGVDDDNGDGRGAEASADAEPAGEVEDAAEAEEPEDAVEDKPKPRRSRARKDEDAPKPRRARASKDEEEPEDDAEHEQATGVLDVLSNGSGFLRRAEGADVYVSPAQIRRCELRPGDDVGGPVRPARRNERHPSLVRVETVNGRAAEPPEERPDFADLTPVHVRAKLAVPTVFRDFPFGKGSRVAVAGPPGAGATRVLREVVSTLSSQTGEVAVTVVLAGARPEEVTDWRREAGVPVSGGSFDSAPDQYAQAAQLAVESAKRVAERGGDAVVVIDSLGQLDPALARRLFGAARNLEEGGSLTIVASVGEGPELLRLASTRVVLAGGSGEPEVAADRSGTQRADLLDG